MLSFGLDSLHLWKMEQFMPSIESGPWFQVAIHTVKCRKDNNTKMITTRIQKWLSDETYHLLLLEYTKWGRKEPQRKAEGSCHHRLLTLWMEDSMAMQHLVEQRNILAPFHITAMICSVIGCSKDNRHCWHQREAHSAHSSLLWNVLLQLLLQCLKTNKINKWDQYWCTLHVMLHISISLCSAGVIAFFAFFVLGSTNVPSIICLFTSANSFVAFRSSCELTCNNCKSIFASTWWQTFRWSLSCSHRRWR